MCERVHVVDQRHQPHRRGQGKGVQARELVRRPQGGGLRQQQGRVLGEQSRLGCRCRAQHHVGMGALDRLPQAQPEECRHEGGVTGCPSDQAGSSHLRLGCEGRQYTSTIAPAHDGGLRVRMLAQVGQQCPHNPFHPRRYRQRIGGGGVDGDGWTHQSQGQSRTRAGGWAFALLKAGIHA